MLFVLLLLAYAAIAACSLNAPLFPLDDTGELYFVRQAGSWSALLGHDFYHFFRPVKNLLFALYDALIRCGAGMHVVRLVPILVGAASAYAVFTLCRRLLNSHGWGLTAAAIWLLAPTLVSCTAWLSCTNILLMAGFAAAALYGHDRAGEAQAAADGPRAAGRWTLFAAVFLALALASYEGAVGTVALSFAVDFYLHPARLRQRATWQRYAVYALVLAVYLACRHALGTAGQELAGSFSNVSPLQAAASAGYFTALHAGTWLWPFGRMAVIGSYFWGQVTPALLAAYWALVLAAAALALLLRRRAPAVALGLAWFLLAFAPTSNVLGFRNGPYGDYYMALASVGAALALAAALRHLWPSGGPGAARTLAVVATTVLIGTRVAATVEAAAWSTVWNDPLKAYAANLRTFPLAFDVMIELAKCNVSRGEFRAADELAARAIGIAPDRRQAYAVRAVTAEHEGRLEDALMMAEAYRRRLNTPQDAWVLGFEADLYADRMGKPERAEPLYREAIANRPWSQDAVRVAGALAFLLAKQGNGSEAIALWEEALQYDPGSATIHHNLARAFGERGDTEKANRHRRLAEAARTAQP